MSSVITSVKDLVTSVFEVIFSVFKSAFDAIYGLLAAVFDLFVGTIRMALRGVGNTLEAAGGIGKFIASNIVVVAIIAGCVYYGYLQYQGRRGRPAKVGTRKQN
ncbi:hypothetical protein N7474_009309 [Penicillium riverlandense]|uniref:uncharacterized protein n=1 Tax=Penicillium riverlandense TaxID=1903569 RepID=UPI0025465866|nr:uncharacterized protein N7474_009309 [Penicillium riverlandense]KAJ5808040.1 hypothetical protein N7474_009309 [Penicillium riverlandense]